MQLNQEINHKSNITFIRFKIISETTFLKNVFTRIFEPKFEVYTNYLFRQIWYEYLQR